MKILILLLFTFVLSSAEIFFRRANERTRKLVENDRPCNFLLTYEERYLSTPHIIERYGYEAERHWTTTEDGYILELHRIPAPGKPVTLLMHGIFGTSRDWVINCDRRALAFKLHEEGYDVWMGNYRGNSYCRNHTKFSYSDPRFWNFAIDEVGYYDGPATIDYVLNSTGKSHLSFVAHSMGNGMALTMLLSRPEYNQKINVWLALSAATHLQDTRSPPIRFMSPFHRYLERVLTLYNGGEFLPHALTSILHRYGPMLCHYEAITKNFHGLCSISYFAADGYDPAQIPSEAFRTFSAGFPSPMSAKFTTQWFQWVISGKLAKFDEGPLWNLRKYGQTGAELYDLENLGTNVYIFWGENDWIVTKESIEKTLPVITKTARMKELVHFVRVNATTFNHLDFLLGKDADVLVYDPVIKILKRYNFPEFPVHNDSVSVSINTV